MVSIIDDATYFPLRYTEEVASRNSQFIYKQLK
jgi:hypothetical protein